MPSVFEGSVKRGDNALWGHQGIRSGSSWWSAICTRSRSLTVCLPLWPAAAALRALYDSLLRRIACKAMEMTMMAP
jgi:hypothetical protein